MEKVKDIDLEVQTRAAVIDSCINKLGLIAAERYLSSDNKDDTQKRDICQGVIEQAQQEGFMLLSESKGVLSMLYLGHELVIRPNSRVCKIYPVTYLYPNRAEHPPVVVQGRTLRDIKKLLGREVANIKGEDYE